MSNQMDLLGVEEYTSRVQSFQRMFDKNDDEFRWVLLRMNKDLGFKVMLDNDETTVVFSEEVEERCEIDSWIGRFSSSIGNSPGINALLDSTKIPWERY